MLGGRFLIRKIDGQASSRTEGKVPLGSFGRRVSFLAEGVKRDSEEAHLLKTVASGGPWHSEVQGEEALLTRLKDWAKSPPE